jgi:hypothetical protein
MQVMLVTDYLAEMLALQPFALVSVTCPGFSPDTGLIRRMQVMLVTDYLAEMLALQPFALVSVTCPGSSPDPLVNHAQATRSEQW